MARISAVLTLIADATRNRITFMAVGRIFTPIADDFG